MIVVPAWEPRFHHPNPVELATCMVTAMADRPDLVARRAAELPPRTTARAVLEEIVLEAEGDPASIAAEIVATVGKAAVPAAGAPW